METPHLARRWTRLQLHVSCFLAGPDESGQEFSDFTKILNISSGGALVLATHPTAPGSQLILEIPVPAGIRLQEHIQTNRPLPVEVVWSRHEGNRYKVGVKFVSP